MFIIAGLYRRQRLKAPKGAQTRPTASRLREALFNICQQNIEGARFLDIFAGSGAMGLEALSRGAQSATFIDAHQEAIHCIESNIEHLKVRDQCQILKGEALAMLHLLERQGRLFDIIYVDPPYRTPAPHTSLFYSASIIQWIDTHTLLVPGGVLFIEEEFRSQPQIDQLQTLKFIDSRRMGHAALQQYQHEKKAINFSELY
jgi:16S rRNA (guanine966-N2)-methyltransferase